LKKRATQTVSNLAWLAFIGLLIFGDPIVLARLAAAVTRTANSVGNAAVASADIIAAGANVTAEVITTGAKALGSTSHLFAEVWQGVDLMDLHIQKSHLRAIARSPRDMQLHWGRNASMEGWPGTVEPLIQKCVGGKLASMATSSRHVIVNSSFAEVECRTLTVPKGTTVLTGIVTWASYRLQWANPLWEIAGLDPATQELEVLEELQEATTAVGPPSDPNYFKTMS